MESTNNDTNYNDLIGQRILIKSQTASIRYVGKLSNNPKAGNDIWVGVEWDIEGQGKHDG